MRKAILILCALAAMPLALCAQTAKTTTSATPAPVTTAAQEAPIKLGHIDRQALMLMLPERAGAEKKMQEFAKSLDDRLKAMNKEYQDKLTSAQARADSMTNTERDVATRELQDLQQRISDAQDKAKDDLSKQENELLAPMVDRTNKAIKEVADENHFTYVFDSSTGMVLYSGGGIDIMPLVKTKLGIQ